MSHFRKKYFNSEVTTHHSPFYTVIAKIHPTIQSVALEPATTAHVWLQVIFFYL